MDIPVYKHIRSTLVITALNAVCTLGKEICEENHVTYTFCEDGYFCCQDNTRCCNSSLTAWEWMGVVMAVLLGLCLCAFCAIYLTKKKKKPRRVIQPTDNVFAPISTITNRMNSRYRFFTLPDYAYLYPQHIGQSSFNENNNSRPSADNNSNTSGENCATPQYDVTLLPSAPVLPPPPYSQEDPLPSNVQPPPPYKETETV